jgi:putative (di)nucleoside polyphosphate hydrolase
LVDETIEASDAAYRPNVGIMLLNDQWRVLVARRIGASPEAWQMPQGGIDAGETPLQAAYRELQEEIGVTAAEFIAESEAWFRYDFPPGALLRHGRPGLRGQRQKWVIMRFTGADRDIDLNATGEPEFDAWRWIPVRELPETIVSFKRHVYIDLLKEFPYLADQNVTDLIADPIVRITMLADGVDDRHLNALLQEATRGIRQRARERD